MTKSPTNSLFYLKNIPKCSCLWCHMMGGTTLMRSLMAWNWKYVCVYGSLGAFHDHWHSSFVAQQMLQGGLNSSVLSLCTSQHMCVSHSLLKIEQAPNYCSKHRCGKLGLPPTKSQTRRPGHSMLCVPVWKSGVRACTRARMHVCKWCRERRESLCWCATESRPHPLKPALQCVGVWAQTHTAPLLVGWKPYTPHQSCHSCIIHTPDTQTHTFSSLDSCRLFLYIWWRLLFFLRPKTLIL